MAIPVPLVEHQKWAKHALHYVGEHVEYDGSMLWSSNPFASSSMFTGAACAERALAYINAARSSHIKALGPLNEA